MIIFKIEGGLGNQLFEYAFAKKITKELNQSLILDLSWIQSRDFVRENYTYRDYQLELLDIVVPLMEHPDRDWYKKKNKNEIRIINEPRYFDFDNSFNFWKQFDHLIEDLKTEERIIYFDGFWQKSSYFLDIIDDLKKEIHIGKKYENSMYDQITKSKSPTCAIHIRRGDFVTNPDNHDFYSNLTENEYLKNAVKYMNDKLENPHYFIFSDDIQWCIENLNIEGEHTFVNIPYKYDPTIQDLFLMKSCQNFIIPTSTFSLWAALLSDNKNSIVIAPKQWYKEERIYVDGFIPENWIRL